ncbi:hypothetical protein QQ999_23760 [Pseudomonas fluorescens]
MKLYENITIGNFLFALGYALRNAQGNQQLAGSVNLLQQTPADKLLGDVLLKFTGVVRLIEFKAHGASITKERDKHEVLSEFIAAKQLERISREVHWYVESKATDTSLGLLTVPYLDAFAGRTYTLTGRLQDFVHNLAQDIAHQRTGYTSKEINDYLLYVRTMQGSGETGTGGLLLLAEPSGRLRYAAINDFADLNMDHRPWVEQEIQRSEMKQQLEIERGAKEYTRKQRLKRDQETNYDGPKFGL